MTDLVALNGGPPQLESFFLVFESETGTLRESNHLAKLVHGLPNFLKMALLVQLDEKMLQLHGSVLALTRVYSQDMEEDLKVAWLAKGALQVFEQTTCYRGSKDIYDSLATFRDLLDRQVQKEQADLQSSLSLKFAETSTFKHACGKKARLRTAR